MANPETPSSWESPCEWCQCSATLTESGAICAAGYYAKTTGGEVASEDDCTACSSGMDCRVAGLTLTTLPCMDFLKGPFCSLCNTTDRYYDSESRVCEECPDVVAWVDESPLTLVAILIGATAAIALLRWMAVHVSQLRAYLILKRMLRHAGLIGKLKIFFTSCQINSRVPSLYDVPIHRWVAELYAWMSYVALEFDILGELSQCLLRLREFHVRLLVCVLVPLGAVLVLVPLVCLVRTLARGSFQEMGWKQALRVAMLDMLYPSVLILYLFYSTVRPQRPPHGVSNMRAMDAYALEGQTCYMHRLLHAGLLDHLSSVHV